MKILALDVGDIWTGTALSDETALVARPYQTTKTNVLEDFLRETLRQEPISTVIVGYPKTMRGTISDQTRKVETLKSHLEEQFPDVRWILWDERLSSKRASSVKAAKTKEEKIHSHSIAAAFILESYLMFYTPDSSEEYGD